MSRIEIPQDKMSRREILNHILEAVPRLLELLQEPHGLVRAHAAGALVNVHSRPATLVPPLMEMLDDADAAVRAEAAWALGVIGPAVRSAEARLVAMFAFELQRDHPELANAVVKAAGIPAEAKKQDHRATSAIDALRYIAARNDVVTLLLEESLNRRDARIAAAHALLERDRKPNCTARIAISVFTPFRCCVNSAPSRSQRSPRLSSVPRAMTSNFALPCTIAW